MYIGMNIILLKQRRKQCNSRLNRLSAEHQVLILSAFKSRGNSNCQEVPRYNIQRTGVELRPPKCWYWIHIAALS